MVSKKPQLPRNRCQGLKLHPLEFLSKYSFRSCADSLHQLRDFTCTDDHPGFKFRASLGHGLERCSRNLAPEVLEQGANLELHHRKTLNFHPIFHQIFLAVYGPVDVGVDGVKLLDQDIDMLLQDLHLI